MTATELLFICLRAEICGEKLDKLKGSLSPELLGELFTLAANHDLAHIPGHVLEDLGWLDDSPQAQALKQSAMWAKYRYIQLEHTLEQACAELENAKIPFVPLKGTVLRQYYPAPWMRTSCDIDILVREEELDRAIEVLKQALYCQCGEKGDHDISLYTAGGVHVELHFDTIQERYAVNNCRDVLAGIWDDAKPDKPEMYAHHLSDEMFYFYHIAHMAKHFGNGGCGVRTFLDVWILNHKVPHDREKREALLKDGGLFLFATKVEKLAEVWFSKEGADDFDRRMSDYILRAGVFGNQENRAAIGQARMGGRVRYMLLRRIFMPYDFLKSEYPILKEHKWLFPFYQVVRWFRVLKNGLVGRTMCEIRANAASSKIEVLAAKELLKELGI